MSKTAGHRRSSGAAGCIANSTGTDAMAGIKNSKNVIFEAQGVFFVKILQKALDFSKEL